MPRSSGSFRQGDVTKAVKGAVAAGIEIERVEVEDGKIVIFAGRNRQDPPPSGDEWDNVR